MTDPAQPPRRPGPLAGVPPDRDVPDWEALARIAAAEPATDDAARAREAAARAWLAAHPAEAARFTALNQALPAASVTAATAAPAVDVEAALSRVRHAAGLDRVASRAAAPAVSRATAGASRAPHLTVVRGGAPRTAPRWRVAAGLLAASAVIATGIRTAWHLGRAPGGRGGTEFVAAGNAAPQHHATRVGERQTLRLADGSQVVLGPASTLDVPAGFGSAGRRVRLVGEAYFRAAHDARRPFEVAAGDAIVRDIGTAFVVRAPERAGRRSGAPAVDVAVTDGAVQLRAAGTTPASDGAAGGVLLRAGDRGRVLAATGATVPAVSVVARGTDVEADTAWTAGRLVFRDAPLTEVAGALRRWYGVQLRFADPALATRHLTATFAGESTDVVLRVVGLATGARLEHRGDTVVVRGAAPSP